MHTGECGESILGKGDDIVVLSRFYLNNVFFFSTV